MQTLNTFLFIARENNALCEKSNNIVEHNTIFPYRLVITVIYLLINEIK